ncbi:GAF and ANTAR domain-containing protein [Amycolatopsis australiensis]|uniref:GAF domain-containing protein n=1 Tax=Amycolatopsis australiensis TaxID=546364 RepID=A0A1K1SRN1_9PSEU|nr:GAF and ANTAR domain-containing protein [Amycolatopsis australiensis]SFW86979.1 GAF domain-containing protein [Amycolatopsis australiensis]
MSSTHDRPWATVLDEVTGALESLTAALDTEDDFAVLLNKTCAQVVNAVPGVDEATITLLTGGRPTTIASTSDVTTALDHDQYAAGHGPCIEAATTGKLVRVPVTDAATKWPDFARDAATAGFGSFLSAPLVVSEEHSGGVNCYSRQGDGFAELDEKLLDLYTSAVTPTLRVYSRYQQARDTVEHLRTALHSRAVIDQAKGILMAVRQVSADKAFTLLVEQSQRENRKVRDLAVQLVCQATGITPA